MRSLLLGLGVLPYLGFAALDLWVHEAKRPVPPVEKWLHAGIGVGIGAFLLFAFLDRGLWAGLGLALGLVCMAADELGYHRRLGRLERWLHVGGAVSLALFVGIWLWTVYRL